MFYDKLQYWCKLKGTTPTTVVKQCGLSPGNLANWKRGVTPKVEILQKLANRLGINMNDLLNDDQKEKPVEDDGPNTLEEAREILRQRGIRVLLDAEAKDFTPEQIKQIVNFILFTDEQSEK